MGSKCVADRLEPLKLLPRESMHGAGVPYLTSVEDHEAELPWNFKASLLTGVLP